MKAFCKVDVYSRDITGEYVKNLSCCGAIFQAGKTYKMDFSPRHIEVYDGSCDGYDIPCGICFLMPETANEYFTFIDENGKEKS